MNKHINKYLIYYVGNLYLTKGLNFIFTDKVTRNKICKLCNLKKEDLNDISYLNIIYECLGFNGLMGIDTPIEETLKMLSDEFGNKFYNIENKILNKKGIIKDFDKPYESEIAKHRFKVLPFAFEIFADKHGDLLYELIEEIKNNTPIDKIDYRKIDKAIKNTFNEKRVKIGSEGSNILIYDVVKDEFEDILDLVKRIFVIVLYNDTVEGFVKFIQEQFRNPDILNDGHYISIQGLSSLYLNTMNNYGSHLKMLDRYNEIKNKGLKDCEEELADISRRLLLMEKFRRIWNFQTLQDLTEPIYDYGKSVVKDNMIITGMFDKTVEIVIYKNNECETIKCELEMLNEILKFKSISIKDGKVCTYGKTIWEKFYNSIIPKDGNYNNLLKHNV